MKLHWRLFASLAGLGLLALAAMFVPSSQAEDGKVKHVTAAEAQKLLDQKSVLALDLRTPAEFLAGHIAGATNIDFRAADFEARLAQLDKSKPWLAYCASGNRSTKALPAFHRLQFQALTHLDGGIKAWTKAGLPVQK